MLKEFRAFIARGNVLDLAVAVIMGGAFGKVVTSLVNDVLMPPIGRVMGGVSFADIYIPLDLAKARTAEGALLASGPGQGGRRPHDQHRALHQRRHRLPHRGVRRLHDRQGGEPPPGEEGRGAGAAARADADRRSCWARSATS